MPGSTVATPYDTRRATGERPLFSAQLASDTIMAAAAEFSPGALPAVIVPGLTAAQVHGLLRAAGESSDGLARRNYALVQLMLQNGLRVGEVAALRRSDVVLRERAGTVRVRNGKGLTRNARCRLNATARRALRQLLEPEPAVQPEAAVFRSGTVMPVRSIQNVIVALTRRAGLAGSDITAHSLRHTFALAWLRQHPGQLVELSQLLGHESLDTMAVYTRASAADLARGVEQTPFNLDG
jgi:integrase